MALGPLFYTGKYISGLTYMNNSAVWKSGQTLSSGQRDTEPVGVGAFGIGRLWHIAPASMRPVFVPQDAG